MADLEVLRREQAAFEAQLDELLPEHVGQYVVFQAVPQWTSATIRRHMPSPSKSSVPMARFSSRRCAKSEPEPTSMAWDAGVMFE